MKPQKIKGLYEKRGWFYYQPPTGEDGISPKPIALGTKDFLEAINLSYAERDRFKLVAATVKDRMAPPSISTSKKSSQLVSTYP